MAKDGNGKGEYKEGLGSFPLRYLLKVFTALAVTRLAGEPTFVLTDNEARNYFAISLRNSFSVLSEACDNI
jgi:hypothetical protein